MRSSQVSGTISEESPAVGAKKFLVWITVGWVSGAGTVFLVLLVLTLGAAQESDDLAGAGSVIAAAAMTAPSSSPTSSFLMDSVYCKGC